MNHEFITDTAQMLQQIAKMLAAADAIQLWVQKPGNLNAIDLAVEKWDAIHFANGPFRTMELLRVMAHLLQAPGISADERLDSYRARTLSQLTNNLSLAHTTVMLSEEESIKEFYTN